MCRSSGGSLHSYLDLRQESFVGQHIQLPKRTGCVQESRGQPAL